MVPLQGFLNWFCLQNLARGRRIRSTGRPPNDCFGIFLPSDFRIMAEYPLDIHSMGSSRDVRRFVTLEV
ncbi:hypothetical protein OUZ56_029777 [Daphnia magna]|uniref:Uncharacterized protein n=1 Tax=Daphnia magna TaxID=35525 RepID=A0ABR0B7T4_9CRUS|nr:hypothetical protein OUZ56_029777 [Daphnia magna]